MEKLSTEEMNVMNYIWDHEPIRASLAVNYLADAEGLSPNTVYTYVTRLIEKGYIRREDPKFICHAAISRDEARTEELKKVSERLFDYKINKVGLFAVKNFNYSLAELNEMAAVIRDKKAALKK